VAGSSQGFVADACSWAILFPLAAVLADRDDRDGLTFDDGLVAAARGEGRPGNGPGDRFRPERAEPKAPSAVTVPIGSSAGIWPRNGLKALILLGFIGG